MPKVSIVVVIMVIFSAPLTLSMKQLRMMYQMEMSRRPRPTTTRPITAPERKATRRPPLRLSRAALAVRAEALVAVFMPRKPERPEKKPPVRNATGTHSFWSWNP